MSLCHWIWLTQMIGDPVQARELLQAFGKAERVYSADEKMLLDTGIVDSELAHRLACMRSLDAAQRVLRDCAALDVHPLTFDDALYPERLRNIPDPPLVLYTRGAVPLFDDMLCISIVGTRKACAHSRRIAGEFAAGLARRGVCVISGMAGGIDSAAHEGALSAGGLTAAVFGCGPDICYPSENRPLMDDILQHGCILSEYAPGSRPSKMTFPRRNRIMAGLSSGVLVVAAPERSGSLITAHLASDYGRDVFVIPGAIDDEEFVGANELMRSGATPVLRLSDIFEEYESAYRFDAKLAQNLVKLPQSPQSVVTAEESRSRRPAAKKSAESVPELSVRLITPKNASAAQSAPSDAPEPAAKPEPAPKEASETNDGSRPRKTVEDFLRPDAQTEELILDALARGYDHPDLVIDETHLDAVKVLSLMTEMELRGVIEKIPGGRYRAL